MDTAHHSIAAQLGGGLIDVRGADVGALRERVRRRRLRTIALVLGPPAAYLWWRIVRGDPVEVLRAPSLPDDWVVYLIPLALIVALVAVIAMPVLSGRSPHLLIRPEDIDVTFDDVKGLDAVVDEVIKTLNTFLAHRVYRDRLGGRPRRGLLFEGPPGTGKTHLAKAMAHHAGVPFLFVSATSFQSMWYGATARRIRSFFRHLRRVARREGGAIGFIEEIDAIAGARGGMERSVALAPLGACPSAGGPAVGSCPSTAAPLAAGTVVHPLISEGTGGVVNELLVQLQSFDEPPLGTRIINWVIDRINDLLPAHRRLRRRPIPYHNVLVIAATNRADVLDPALLRPGRFDRRLTFEPPARQARRELIDYLLARRAHAPELDDPALRDQLAGQTFGYTPAMLEHILDEALVVALRHGRDAMTWADVQEARLTAEVGLRQPVALSDAERRRVATHESGHATIAYLVGGRRLEVLSIIKRSRALGLLAHGDPDDVHLRSRSELEGLIAIALGGLVAEELWFGEPSTGASADLAAATRMACELVGAAGMGGTLVSLAAVQQGPLNATDLVGRVLGDPETRPVVEQLLARRRAEVRALLDANRHLVEALRDALLDRDELIGDEITAVLEAAGPAVREIRDVDRRVGERRRRDLLAEPR